METVTFAFPCDSDDPHFHAVVTNLQDHFHGKVLSSTTNTVTMEFASENDALEAANEFPQNNRLEDVPGTANVRLSAAPLWEPDDAVAVAERHRGELQEVAATTGFVKPNNKH